MWLQAAEEKRLLPPFGRGRLLHIAADKMKQMATARKKTRLNAVTKVANSIGVHAGKVRADVAVMWQAAAGCRPGTLPLASASACSGFACIHALPQSSLQRYQCRIEF